MGSVFLHTGALNPVQFQFTGGPIDDPQTAHIAFATLGHAAMAWARLETQVDALLIHVNKASHSKEIYSPDHAKGFEGKLELLKKWFKNHPELKPMAEDMRAAVTGLKKLSKIRNQTLHAIFERYDADQQRLHFMAVKYEGKGTFRVRSYSATIKALQETTAQVVQVNKMFWDRFSSKCSRPRL